MSLPKGLLYTLSIKRKEGKLSLKQLKRNLTFSLLLYSISPREGGKLPWEPLYLSLKDFPYFIPYGKWLLKKGKEKAKKDPVKWGFCLRRNRTVLPFTRLVELHPIWKKYLERWNWGFYFSWNSNFLFIGGREVLKDFIETLEELGWL